MLLTYTLQSPCHSRIIDPIDINYVESGLFTETELQEIREFDSKLMLSIPQELDSYINSTSAYSSKLRLTLTAKYRRHGSTS